MKCYIIVKNLKKNIKYKILVININRTFDNKRDKKNSDPVYSRPNIYEVTRSWWALDNNKAVPKIRGMANPIRYFE